MEIQSFLMTVAPQAVCYCQNSIILNQTASTEVVLMRFLGRTAQEESYKHNSYVSPHIYLLQ
jgi:hypothetical protein